MNVKNKIFAIAMSFIICFCTVGNSFCNDKEYTISPLVVDGGVVTAPMVATISALAVASGIVLSSNENIYDVAYLFYQKHKENWENVKTVFDSCVSIGANKVVTVGNEFLKLVKDCFDTYFTPYDSESNVVNLQSFGSVPSFYNYTQAKGYLSSMPSFTHPLESNFSFNGTDFTLDEVVSNSNGKFYYYKFDSIYGAGTGTLYLPGAYSAFKVYVTREDKRLRLYGLKSNGEWVSAGGSSIYIPSNYALTYDLPYTPGSYSPGGVLDSDNLDIYVPNNVGSLVGSLPSDVVGNPPYEYGGTITLPNVSNPSIDSSLSGTFNPSLDTDVPIEKPGGIVFPPMGSGLDFTPITQGSFTDKFPFSLAKDIKNILSVFDVEPKAPIFNVPIVTEELEIDLTDFNIWASIVRFFVLIGFIISLINITRKVIG